MTISTVGDKHTHTHTHTHTPTHTPHTHIRTHNREDVFLRLIDQLYFATDMSLVSFFLDNSPYQL